MEGPADTLVYFVAGYVTIFVIMSIYLASLIIRHRNLRQEEEMLKSLEAEEKNR
jgi:hypothetical protein